MMLFLIFGSSPALANEFTINEYNFIHSLSTIKTSDYNNDAKTDIAALSRAGNAGVSIYLIDGEGHLGAPQRYVVGSPNLVVYRNDGTSYVGGSSEAAPVDFSAGDIDHDDDIDLVFANFGEPDIINTSRRGVPGSISVLKNNGLGSFALFSSYQFDNVDKNPSQIELADYDKDGDLDSFLLLESQGDIVVFDNDGTGIMTPVSTINIDDLPFLSSRKIKFFVNDFDGDQRADVFVSYSSSNNGREMRLYKGMNNHIFVYSDAILTISSSYNADVSGAFDSEVADFDNDGDIDVVAAFALSNFTPRVLSQNGYITGLPLLVYFINNGQGRFTQVEGKLLPYRAMRDLQVVDFDNDGLVDVVSSGPLWNTDYDVSQVDLFRNSGNYNFTETRLISNYSKQLFFGNSLDINNDALTDFVYGSNTGLMFYTFTQSEDVQSSPILTPIVNQTVAEATQLSFVLSATDPDNNPLVYSTTNLPAGATLNPITGVFSWTPTYTDAGTYHVTFTATDNATPALSDSKTVDIIVTNTNRAPILNEIGSQNTLENQNLTFTLSATDPDGDALTYSAANLPAGATFNPTTRTFSWATTYTQAGNYNNVEFTVTDNGSPLELDVELITITVGDINRAPEFISPGTQEVMETHNLTFTLSATDPDGDSLTYGAIKLPIGATFNPSTRIFSWTPTRTQSGVYTPTFTTTDNATPAAVGTVDVVITVGDSPTPSEQAQTLVNTVNTLLLPTNIKNSYLANLQKVGNFITDGKIQSAINQLNAFINKVNQDCTQGKITLAVRNNLVSLAQQLVGEIQ